jgi:hypothetical protein
VCGAICSFLYRLSDAERRDDATPVGVEASISRGDLVEVELREKKGRPGIPLRPFLAYTLPNSQWYIQWLRTLRNRGAERVPKNYRKPVDVSTLTGFFHGENRDVTMREGDTAWGCWTGGARRTATVRRSHGASIQVSTSALWQSGKLKFQSIRLSY